MQEAKGNSINPIKGRGGGGRGGGGMSTAEKAKLKGAFDSIEHLK